MIGKIEITATTECVSASVHLEGVSITDKIQLLSAVAHGLEMSPDELKSAAFLAAIAMEIGLFNAYTKQVADEG